VLFVHGSGLLLGGRHGAVCARLEWGMVQASIVVCCCGSETVVECAGLPGQD
jgi:hypothetical protein